MNRAQQKAVRDAVMNEHLLTDWEARFISDLASENPFSYELTDKQSAALNRIRRKLARGQSGQAFNNKQ